MCAGNTIPGETRIPMTPDVIIESNRQILMMEAAHKGVLNEIEKSRVISLYLQDNSREDYDFSSSTKPSRATGIIRAKSQVGHNCKQSRSHRGQASVVCDGKHALDSSKKSSTVDSQFSVSEILNYGMLYKTSRGKITSDLKRGHHEHRQYRRFQLTEHSLEYSQLLQRVSNTT